MGDRAQRVKGKAEETKGRVKRETGEASARPGTEARGTGEELKGKEFVVALEKDRTSRPRQSHQSIKHFARSWSPINVVAEEYLERRGDRIGEQICINTCKQWIEEIETTVDVCDGVDANAVGKLDRKSVV